MKEGVNLNITHFDKIRIKSESSVKSVFMDINRFPDGCSSGFMVTAYEIPSMPKEKWASHKIEIRRKERQVALLTYKYSDAEIPEWWKDAEVLYSWEQIK